MTAKSLKKSQGKRAGHATNAERSGVSNMKPMAALPPSKLSLVALNDIYVIEEDPIATDTGLSAAVDKALSSGLLVLPENVSNFAEKFPCTGRVIAKGPATKYEDLQVGVRVMFARLGVQRWKLNGKSICNCKEQEIHGIIFD